MNIAIVKNIFPTILRLGVIPMDNPVLLRADVLSNKISRKDAFSIAANTATSIINTKTNERNITKDLCTVSSGIALLKI